MDVTTEDRTMNDTMLKKISCDAIDLTSDSQVNKETGVRVYPYAPHTISLQIRSYGSTSQRRGGVPKHIVSSCYLGPVEAKNLIALLQQFVSEQEA